MNLILKKLNILFYFLIFMIFFNLEISGQDHKICYPNDLRVVGNHVNFREGPDLHHKILRHFNNGEKLIYLDEYESGDGLWYHVKSAEFHDEGYVHSDYALPLEIAYFQAQDCDKLQSGYWYGVSVENAKIFLNSAKPKLEKREGQNLIFDNQENNQILICSATKLKDGEIEGMMNMQGVEIRLGDSIHFFQSTKGQFLLIYTSEIDNFVDDGGWNNSKIRIQSSCLDSTFKNLCFQDITSCFDLMGEGVFYLYFSGDINRDGYPEFIISEATTNTMILYFFKSGHDGNYKLASKNIFKSKC